MPPSTNRLPALDTLRVVAILAVMNCHIVGSFGLNNVHPMFTRFLGSGTAGVDLFFVLSGFLIARIILAEFDREGGLHLKRFWWRRWMRTLPAYYVTLAVIAASDFIVLPERGWVCFPAYLGFLQTYVIPQPPPRFVWSWSLCTEEWFYVSFPIVVLLLLRARMTHFPATAIRVAALLAIATSICFRQYIFWQVSGEADVLGAFFRRGTSAPHARLDGLAVGVFLATCRGFSNGRWAWIAAGVSLIGIGILWFVEFPDYLYVYKYTFFALCFGLLVALSVGSNAWSRLSIPGMRYLADMSYSLFLVHPILVKAVPKLLSFLPYAAQFVAFAFLTVVGSLLLRYGVERPGLWLRDRLSKRKSVLRPEAFVS